MNLIRPHRELLIPGHTMRVAGYVSWELIHARTGVVVRRSRPRPNLVTDAALNAMGTNSITNLTQFCGVGTDNTPPDDADTGLIAQVGGRVNANGGISNVFGSGPSNAYAFQRKTRLFLEAEGNGNLTEVGMFSAASGGTMFCRHLFVDDLGDPTVIVKTTDFQLRVVYEFRIYFPLTVNLQEGVTISDWSGDVRTNLLNHTNMVQQSSVDFQFDWPGFSSSPAQRAVGHEPNGGLSFGSAGPSTPSAVATSVTVAGYTTGNFYRDITALWGPSVANFATGFGGVFWGTETFISGVAQARRRWWTRFSPKITQKVDGIQLSLVLRQSWARYVEP